MSGRSRTWALPSVLMALSGFAGLGLQMVWTQQLGAWLGHEIVSVLAVIVAFFGGLALGAWALGVVVSRSAVPHRWYAACEGVIALWAVLLAWGLGPANAALAMLTGPAPSPLWQWAVAFTGPFLLLLPATAAMGATLPAMTAAVGRLRDEGFAIGGLYAANTLGAVGGVLVITLVMVPAVGLTASAWLCASLNAACAVLAYCCLLPKGVLPSANSGADEVPQADASTPAGGLTKSRVLALLTFTGLLGIGYEVVVVRALSQITENTPYTFALLLAVYLLATAAGAAAYQRWLPAGKPPQAVGRVLLQAAAITVAGSVLLLGQAGELHRHARAWLGEGFGAALGAEALLAAAVFAAPSLVMGALFTHLCVMAKNAGSSLGLAVSVNTVGAALAPLVFGVLLMPILGPKALVLAIAAAYVLVAWALPMAALPRRWPAVAPVAGALVMIAAASVSTPLVQVDVPPGGRVVSHRDGVMAAVSVVEDASGVASLHINNRQQEGSTATGLADARLAYLPLLLADKPRSALFLGLGTGVTARAAAENTAMQVDAVELVPEVIDAAAYFKTRMDVNPPLSQPVTGHPRVWQADARRFVRSSTVQYDVVVADLFHPARSGAAALYTVEHFAAVRSRVAPGGLFCQWLPLHQMDVQTLAHIVQSFMAVYPSGMAVLASNSLNTPVLGLVARPDGQPFDGLATAQRMAMASPAALARRSALRIEDEFALFGSFIAGPQSLLKLAGGAALNTDDQPVVAQRAARVAYAPDTLPSDRLLQLLSQLSVRPDEVLGATTAGQGERQHARLAAYWAARQAFIELGVGVQPSSDPRAMLDQVGLPLLRILKTSPDFRPAYDPLLAMASALSRADRAVAEQVWSALVAVQPARPEAALALRTR